MSTADVAGRAARLLADEGGEVGLRDESRAVHDLGDGKPPVPQKPHGEAQLFASDDLRRARPARLDKRLVEMRPAHLQLRAERIQPHKTLLQVRVNEAGGLVEEGVAVHLEVAQLGNHHVRQVAQRGGVPGGRLVRGILDEAPQFEEAADARRRPSARAVEETQSVEERHGIRPVKETVHQPVLRLQGLDRHVVFGIDDGQLARLQRERLPVVEGVAETSAIATHHAEANEVNVVHNDFT